MIGIIGDTHFGAGYNIGKVDVNTQLNTRLLDFSTTFDNIIDKFVQNDVETVFLTGDIFETRHPTAAQLNEFSKCAQRAMGMGLKLVIVIGNHDQMRHISTTTVDLFAKLKLPALTVYQDMGVHRLNDTTSVILMPYRDKRMLELQSHDEAVAALKASLSKTLESLVGQTVIVIGHYMFERGNAEFDMPSSSMNELMLPTDMFDGCDAVIMGHQHKPGVLSKSNPVIIYSGSMDKVSYGERDHTKISIVMDEGSPSDYKILKSNTRNLYELSFDYLDDKAEYGAGINDKIKADINDFDSTNPMLNAIVKLSVRMKETDLHYINHSSIKEFVMGKNVHCCTGIHTSSISYRQLRNSNITELLSGKLAFGEYLDGVDMDSDKLKKSVLKYGKEIIDMVEGK